MSQAGWIKVDPRFAQKSGEPTKEVVRGVTVSVQISPFDQPEAFRGYYIEKRGVFRIEFKYPDEEPGEPHRADGMVTVELGRYSRKLLAIDVAVDKHNLGVVELQLLNKVLKRADETVKHLQTTTGPTSARLNYRAVDEVLQQSRERPELLVPA